MVTYNKTLTPPEGEPFLVTEDGLKYWEVRNISVFGRKASVLTEDPDIAIHRYAGAGREQGPTYLYSDKGFQIGFLCHIMDVPWLPNIPVPTEKPKKREPRL